MGQENHPSYHSLPKHSVRIVDYAMSWEEINDNIRNERFELFGRFEKAAEYYHISSVKIKSEWLTVSDFIVWREFQLPFYIDEKTGLKYCKPKEDFDLIQVERTEERFGGVLEVEEEEEEEEEEKEEEKQEKQERKIKKTKKIFYSFHENDYGYALEKPISHCLIWSLPRNLTPQERQKVLEKEIGLKNGEGVEGDYLVFENPPALRSIPQIFHFQVFTRDKVGVLGEKGMRKDHERLTQSGSSSKN